MSARFLVINGTTYWQIPMVQTGSNVLGGYITVETRTGKAVFYNREQKSMVDLDTATTQVERYLVSGPRASWTGGAGVPLGHGPLLSDTLAWVRMAKLIGRQEVRAGAREEA